MNIGFSIGSIVFGMIYGQWGAYVMYLSTVFWAAVNALLLSIIYILWAPMRQRKQSSERKHSGERKQSGERKHSGERKQSATDVDALDARIGVEQDVSQRQQTEQQQTCTDATRTPVAADDALLDVHGSDETAALDRIDAPADGDASFPMPHNAI